MRLLYRDPQNIFTELDIPAEGGIIGYDPDNFIVIDAIGISAKHMRLTSSGDELYIEDLQSLNGTYLNQELLAEKTCITPGDLVQIGLLQLHFSKEAYSWSLTVEEPPAPLFTIDECEEEIYLEEPEEFSTAVTVVASQEVKEAIKAGNIAMLQLQEPPLQKVNEVAIKRSSLESIKELGKYKIIKKIGKGGMGVVFLARHKVLNSYRALKVLPHSVKEENYDFYERFMREARIAFDIRHPNIVGVMDAEADAEQEVSYIVMEFIDGGNLRRILKIRKRLCELQTLLIGRCIAAALTDIAEHKIVHRDIKPDNIMFTRHGEVKLADLGIAKNDNEDANITQSDAMIGTPAYLSPEQIEKPKEVDIRSDIYSLGVTLYEMLTGTPPYTGKNTYDIVHKMLSEPIPDPRLKNPEISSVTARIIMKMLQKSPGKRYQSPQALINVLDRILPHYSENEIQEIIKSAVLGTELPKGVAPSISSGVGTFIGFLFFSFRQNIAHPFRKRKKETIDMTPEKMENIFGIKGDLQEFSVTDMRITVKTQPDRTFELLSSAGEKFVLKSDENGYIQITNLSAGEYTLGIHKKEDLKQ